MRKIRKTNDQGIALVTVLIVIALTMTLAGSLLSVAGLSYRMKVVNEHSEDNFYSAEGVVDEVQEIVQGIASNCLASATTSKSSFITAVSSALTTTDAGAATDVASLLKSKLDESVRDQVQLSVDRIDVGTDALTLKGVSVSYTDEDGYNDSISTDIVVNAPTYKVSETSGGLGTYSMFAGGGITIKGDGDGEGAQNIAYLEQEGNIYIGAVPDSNGDITDTALTMNNTTTIMCSGDNVKINGDIYIDGHSNVRFTGKTVTVYGKIYIKNKSNLLLGEGTTLLCKDIVVDGASIKSKGYRCYEAGTGTSENFPFKLDRINNDINDSNAFECKISAGYTGNYVVEAYHKQDSSYVYYLDSDGSYYHVTTDTSGNLLTKDGNEYACIMFPANESDLDQEQNVQVTYKKGTEWKEVDGVWKEVDVMDTVKVDAEFAKFINVETLVKWHNKYGDERLKITKYISDALEYDEDKGYYVATTTKTESVPSALSTFHYVGAKYYTSGYDYTFNYSSDSGIMLSGSQTINNLGKNRFIIAITYKPFEFQLNNNGDYVGILMSMQNAVLDLKQGAAVGRSILTTTDTTSLKSFMDILGNCCVYRDGLPSDETEKKDTMGLYSMNSLFNGGTSIFYTDPDKVEGSTGTVNTTSNKTMNFIELKDWTKQ
jgi:hypothetical protein